MVTTLIHSAGHIINCKAWEMFAEECEIIYPGNFLGRYINIFAPNQAKAKQLWFLKRKKLAEACRDWEQKLVRIFWSLNDRDKPIPIRPIKEGVNTIMTDQSIITDPYNTPVAPELDLNWQDCWTSPDAMWVIDQASQRVLYANPAAIAANGNKPPTEVLNNEINALWEDEALNSLTKLVNTTTGWLREHSNVGFRWARNEEDGGIIWTRKKHEFHVDYKKISYLGLTCRFEHVKAAIAV